MIFYFGVSFELEMFFWIGLVFVEIKVVVDLFEIYFGIYVFNIGFMVEIVVVDGGLEQGIIIQVIGQFVFLFEFLSEIEFEVWSVGVFIWFLINDDGLVFMEIE